ncbi:MAG: hypothetical protein AB7R69_00400 [Candidatus Babeliales bacterium]
MTTLLYLQDPKQLESKVTILSEGMDERGKYFITDKTPCYPQGGGQPADQGLLALHDASYTIKDVRKVEGEIRHYCDQQISLQEPAFLTVDAARRVLNTRYHTAGHLLSLIVENLDSTLKAIKGHQFPGEAYVEFVGTPQNSEQLLTDAQNYINRALEQNFGVVIKNLEGQEACDYMQHNPGGEFLATSNVRLCIIGDFKPVACGGTHVEILSSLGTVQITKIKTKKGNTKISYMLP